VTEPAKPAEPTAPLRADVPAEPVPRWRGWLREPLLHFMLIGAVLFAVDATVNPKRDDARTIHVDAAVDREAIEVFREARGQAPNEDELYALRRVWLDNEVLYREGLALRLDEGDKTIRDRVIFKMLSTINAGLQLPPIDEAGLRAWFEKNRSRYDEPARLDFQEAVLDGDSSEAAARTFAAALQAGAPGDARAGLRVFKGRPESNIAQSFGADFLVALKALPLGRWEALPHRDGWRVVRLEALSGGQPARFEALGGAVVQDWKDAVMAERRTAAVRELARRYTVRVSGQGS
jgi:hypothetical protein